MKTLKQLFPLIFLFTLFSVKGQTMDYKNAPNSYIFDPFQQSYDGLYIPVKKAYAMWNNDTYIGGEPIAGGNQQGSLYWEDISGLIKSTTLEGTGENAKIKVIIDKTKGKGNAVIAYKVNGEIKWSWHIWVTDDPTNGSTYRQGFEKNKDGQLIPDAQWQWMDRNLGAINSSFLGNDWNRSAGLMYQWGRKDPFPPLQYKDGTSYEIYGEIGEKDRGDFQKIEDTDTTNPFGWIFRPFNSTGNHNEIAQNLKYTVKNPLRMMTFLGKTSDITVPRTETNEQKSIITETWFSDTRFKVDASGSGAELQRVNFDLWGDTRKGLASHVTSSNTTLKLDSETYELKSAFDPCPNGWRIPSRYSSAPLHNIGSPWGRKMSGGIDDQFNDWSASSSFFLNPAVNGGQPSSIFTVTTINNTLPNVKVYPSIGYDFNSESNRNLGFMPLTGAYVFVGPNEASDYVETIPDLVFSFSVNHGTLHTSTLSSWFGNGEMSLYYLNDNFETPQESDFLFATSQAARLKGANPCRCIKDPNFNFIGDFETEYVASSTTVDYDLLKQWSKEPNSYIVLTKKIQSKKIKIRKAYAMHKLELSGDNFELPSNLSVHTVWTTNQNLINNLSLNNTTVENSEITVNLNSNQHGNAVIALHAGTSNQDPILWSWHIWAPETNPELNTIVYETESVVNHPNPQIINHTKNGMLPPLKTEFMNRNLGALDVLPSGNPTEEIYKKSIGLHYQWGRKDPIPTFLDQENILVKGSSKTSAEYNSSHVTNISYFNSIFSNSSLRQNEKDNSVIKYTVENPLNFIYNPENKDWISNKQGMKGDRWGHATEKSPYDPCPDGWRIPDTSVVFFNDTYLGNGSTNYIAGDGRKGFSPWYLGNVPDPNKAGRFGINQLFYTDKDGNPNDAATNSLYYKGSYISSSMGWSFNDPVYTIGNFPRTGIRGEENAGVANNFPRALVWTAALDDDLAGNAFALSMRWNKMQTGDPTAPALGGSCRCVKDKAMYSNEEETCSQSTSWDGIAWSNGVPDLNKKAIVNGSLILNSDLEACELVLTDNGNLMIPSGYSFTVNGKITNYAAPADFIVSSGANLIQIENVENRGEITVLRNSQPMKRLDYTLWSSPVIDQNLFGFSPNTVNGVTNFPGSTGRIYIYSGTSQYINPTPFTANAVMKNANGYLYRSPNDWSATTPTPYPAKFIGIPFNGDMNVNTIAGSFTSVGNPYPSNINADNLLIANPNVSALYFWNNTGISGNNYATYTLLGGTAAAGGSAIPNGVISVGQGFLVENSNTSVNFDNTMRISDAGIFFKAGKPERHRIWLSLSNEQNQIINYILVGYMDQALKKVNNQIDGKLLEFDGSVLYSILGEEKLTIQGRSLPFENSDVVPLGFTAKEYGKFNIALSDFDGIFAEGKIIIYLRDKKLNIIHNLTDSEYNFESAKGDFIDRFEIVYSKTESNIENEDLNSSAIQIYTENQHIVANSNLEKMHIIELFDLQGRIIHRNDNVNAISYKIKPNYKGVLVVKVLTQNGKIVSKKIILH